MTFSTAGPEMLLIYHSDVQDEVRWPRSDAETRTSPQLALALGT